MDAENEADLALIDKAVQESHAVVSMLPYLLHAKVAEMAIKHGRPFLTTSYVSDAMRKLEPAAIAKGIVMINECGVDPGTDHMSAMKVFDHVHEHGGKIVSFLSYCGGLPAPEDNNNPLGYKFSWAPRGVLLASRNNALFLQDGKEVTIPGKELFANYKLDSVEGAGEFECYPNRNSVQYLDIYPLRGECKTITRGTYRNKGWCNAIKALADLDYLNADVRDLTGLTYADLTRALVGTAAVGVNALRQAVADKVKLPFDSHQLSVMNWLDLFSERYIPALRAGNSTPLDALCASMLEKMQYAPGERDLLVMKHTFVAEFPTQKKRQVITSKMIDFGIKNGDSSMSRTVSLPVAIVTRLVLDGVYKDLKGLQLPLAKRFYEPILKELAELGIHFVEKIEKEEAM